MPETITLRSLMTNFPFANSTTEPGFETNEIAIEGEASCGLPETATAYLVWLDDRKGHRGGLRVASGWCLSRGVASWAGTPFRERPATKGIADSKRKDVGELRPTAEVRNMCGSYDGLPTEVKERSSTGAAQLEGCDGR